MPDLDFQITGVEGATHGLTPLLQFQVAVRNEPEDERIQAVMLQAQIQIQSPQRAYNAEEKEKLSELFGPPERWGQTLRNRLWGFSNTTVRSFTGRTETMLPVPCTFDLNVAATKYFYALQDGSVPLLFLFSGSVFYESKQGKLQVQQISWNKECTYQLPLQTWKQLMDEHFPNTSWLYLHRDTLEKLYAFKRDQGFTTWDETLGCLLGTEEKVEVAV